MKSVEVRVKEIIADQLCLEVDKIENSSTFEDLGIDSLDAVEITMDIEEEFSIEIEEEATEKIDCVQGLIDLVINLT